MIHTFKKKLYFPFAYYFFIFAKIQLFFWKPKIICITGSSGKTTLLHLMESQIENAHYSFNANSAYGVPFDILGIKRNSYSVFEWPAIFLSAPFRAFKKPFKEKLYIVEADCDRQNEGKFLSNLLKPFITVWLSSSTTHVQNFNANKFNDIEEAVAFEYGYFIENTKKRVYVNNDSEKIRDQLKRADAEIERVSIKDLVEYEVFERSVVFKTLKKEYRIPYLLPREAFYSIEITERLLKYLGLPFDESFQKFSLPPGRSSLFEGIKSTKIIDSSYNSSSLSLQSMMELLNLYSAKKKWIVIGDILELGEKEKEEHEKIAKMILRYNFSKVILVGPRTQKFTYPILKDNKNVISFIEPLETLKYLEENIEGGETILFKGARFLEGIIEKLLENKKDAALLCRREKIWQKRREKWGL